MKFTVILQKDEDGVTVAEVPALPGYISQRATRAEAVENIHAAIAGCLESLRVHGDPIPPPIDEETIEVTV
jgi:predicted RNase H-like HicB family nuclease